MDKDHYKKDSNHTSLYASFLRRLGAFSFDWFFCQIAFLPLFLFFSYKSSSIKLILFSIIYVAYNSFFIYKRGATFGKRFAGIRVIKEKGEISFKDALIRELMLKPLSFILLGTGFFYMKKKKKRQTYYDKLLNLIVLQYPKLNLVKKLFLLILIIFYVIYLIRIIMIPQIFYQYIVNNEKSVVIESIKEKEKVINALTRVINESHENEKLNEINSQREKLCQKKYFGFGKKNCPLEELSVGDLKILDQKYEDLINYIYSIQIKNSH